MKKSSWRLFLPAIALSAAIIAGSGIQEGAWAESGSQGPSPEDYRYVYQTEIGDALATDFRAFLGPLIMLTEPSKPGPTNVVQPTPPPPPPPPVLPPPPPPPPSPLVIDNVTGYGADPETGRIVVITSSGNIREFTFGTPGVRINWATGIEGPPDFIKGPHHPPGGGFGPGPGQRPPKPPAGGGGGQVKPPANTGGGGAGGG